MDDRRHFGVQRSRLFVFGLCAALTSLTVVAQCSTWAESLRRAADRRAGSLGLFRVITRTRRKPVKTTWEDWCPFGGWRG